MMETDEEIVTGLRALWQRPLEWERQWRSMTLEQAIRSRLRSVSLDRLAASVPLQPGWRCSGWDIESASASVCLIHGTMAEVRVDEYASWAPDALRGLAAQLLAVANTLSPPPQPRRDLHDTGRADEGGLEVGELEHDPRASE